NTSFSRPGNGTPGTGHGDDETHRTGPGRTGAGGAVPEDGRSAAHHGHGPEKQEEVVVEQAFWKPSARQLKQFLPTVGASGDAAAARQTAFNSLAYRVQP